MAIKITWENYNCIDCLVWVPFKRSQTHIYTKTPKIIVYNCVLQRSGTIDSLTTISTNILPTSARASCFHLQLLFSRCNYCSWDFAENHSRCAFLFFGSSLEAHFIWIRLILYSPNLNNLIEIEFKSAYKIIYFILYLLFLAISTIILSLLSFISSANQFQLTYFEW